MRHSNNYSDFHLDRVKKENLLLLYVPNWINPCFVHTVWTDTLPSFEIVAASKQIEWDTEKVVVDEPTESTENSHE